MSCLAKISRVSENSFCGGKGGRQAGREGGMSVNHGERVLEECGKEGVAGGGEAGSFWLAADLGWGTVHDVKGMLKFIPAITPFIFDGVFHINKFWNYLP